MPEEYSYHTADAAWDDSDIWQQVRQYLPDHQARKSIFELGCGNGFTAGRLISLGFDVTAVDPSTSGIKQAKAAHPEAKFYVRSAYDDLGSEFGQFPVVISLEVVEHVFSPATYAATLRDLLEPGGQLILSTPYHGYLKNIALAVLNRFDTHWSPNWEGGHIKFWSKNTIHRLLEDAGFVNVQCARVGRIPPLAKSMVITAIKPAPS